MLRALPRRRPRCAIVTPWRAQLADATFGTATQHVRIVHLTAPVFRALADGDLAAANALSPLRLSPYFAGPERRGMWEMRTKHWP
jgi:hypothetical protein